MERISFASFFLGKIPQSLYNFEQVFNHKLLAFIFNLNITFSYELLKPTHFFPYQKPSFKFKSLFSEPFFQFKLSPPLFANLSAPHPPTTTLSRPNFILRKRWQKNMFKKKEKNVGF